MKHRLKFLLKILFLIAGVSCSEGDVITTEIDFEAMLDSCGSNDNDSFVFYKVSEDQTELLSFGFESTTFDIDAFFEEDIRVALNDQSNRLTYRKLTESIDPKNYFCTSIPPADTNIDLELQSANGEGVFRYTLVEETNETITFDRSLVMVSTTLRGNGISLRNEVIILGTQRLSRNK